MDLPEEASPIFMSASEFLGVLFDDNIPANRRVWRRQTPACTGRKSSWWKAYLHRGSASLLHEGQSQVELTPVACAFPHCIRCWRMGKFKSQVGCWKHIWIAEWDPDGPECTCFKHRDCCYLALEGATINLLPGIVLPHTKAGAHK